MDDLDLVFPKDDIVTGQYDRINYHQKRFPKLLFPELLQTLYGAAHKHSVISKLLHKKPREVLLSGHK